MKYLGIDFGLKKVGLAIAVTSIAEPLMVIRYNKSDEAVEKAAEIIMKEKVDMVVVGLSEGKMKKPTLEFVGDLAVKTGVKIVYRDETLSTRDAQRLSIEAGIKRKKRKDMEDAYSATLILQSFLDAR